MSARALRILLVCSLVLNVFVVGGVAGAALMWRRIAAERPLAGVGRPQRLRQAAMHLSPPYRRALRRVVAETARTLRPEAARARAARLEAARLLASPRLDRPALDATLARGRAADAVIRTRLEQRLADFAATLPAAERIALAEALMRGGRRGGSQAARSGRP